MSQHSDPISALSNHLASPALLTSNGPLGAVWPFENGVFWLKATLDSMPCGLKRRAKAMGVCLAQVLSRQHSALGIGPDPSLSRAFN